MQILAVFIFCHPYSDISLQVTTGIRSLAPLAADKLSDFSWWLGSTLADRSLNCGKKSGFSRKQVKVTVSIGLAAPVGQVTNPEKVIKAADKNLFKAKKSGRNRTAY